MSVFLKFAAALIFILPALKSQANESEKPLWELGGGIGYIEFEQYPASNQFYWLTVPLPTFQYRGELLRADDRDGARAYVVKESKWSFDLTGNFRPGLSSSDNNARQGMPDLPWIFSVGPQLVYDLNSKWELRLGAMQALYLSTPLLKTTGGYFDARVLYKWDTETKFIKGQSAGNLAFSLQGATQDYLATYFDVAPQYATPTRSSYSSVSGLLLSEISIFESFTIGRTSYYLGGYLDNYDISANRGSPLHKSDHNLTFFFVVSYTFAKSEKKAYSDKETEGLVNKYFEHENQNQ